MKPVVIALALSCSSVGIVAAARAGSPGPSAIAGSMPIAAPLDRPYPGELQLSVDASDVSRRVVHVHETLSGVGRDPVLLYPKWLPGTHAPQGTIDRLAGLKIAAKGTPLAWTRDPVDPFAFRVHAGTGIGAIEIG